MLYEDILQIADENVLIKEKPLRANKGRIKGNRIAIKQDMTQTEKACILAEELGHYYTTTGCILDQQIVDNRKQELRARFWGHSLLVNPANLIKAFENGCRNRYEIAEYLEVTEEFLQEAIETYKIKYGEYITYKNYTIILSNGISMLKMF